MKHLSLLIAAFALVLTQCERHSWEDVEDEHGNVTEKGTKRLFEGHDEHGGDDAHGGEGAGHDKDAEAHATDGEGHDKDAKKPEAAHDHDGDGKADH